MTITWKNIEAPDFRGAQFGLSEASRLIGGAIDTVGALANQQRQFNINEEQQQASIVGELQRIGKDVDTQAALDQIAGITDMGKYRDTELSNIIAKNARGDRKEIRDAFLAQEKRIRNMQELTPDQRMEWDLAQKFINTDASNQIEQLNQMKAQAFDRFGVDETLVPSQEVRSLADVQQYLNKNVSDDWKFFGWFNEAYNRTDATEELPKVIQKAHEDMLAKIPEDQRSAYREIDPTAAQLAVESALLNDDGRISLSRIAENYIDYVRRLEKNKVNRAQRDIAQNQFLIKSNAVNRKAQEATAKSLEKIRGY